MSGEPDKRDACIKAVLVLVAALVASQTVSLIAVAYNCSHLHSDEQPLLFVSLAIGTAAIALICISIICANDGRTHLLCWSLLAYVVAATGITQSCTSIYDLACRQKVVRLLFFFPGPQLLVLVFAIVPVLRKVGLALVGLALLAGVQFFYWMLMKFAEAICSIT